MLPPRQATLTMYSYFQLNCRLQCNCYSKVNVHHSNTNRRVPLLCPFPNSPLPGGSWYRVGAAVTRGQAGSCTPASPPTITTHEWSAAVPAVLVKNNSKQTQKSSASLSITTPKSSGDTHTTLVCCAGGVGVHPREAASTAATAPLPPTPSVYVQQAEHGAGRA